MVGFQTGAIPAALRRANERTVISLLSRMGAASRADLAKAAGLSQPTAGKITSDLLELGILQEVTSEAITAKAPAKVGRPGRLLRLNRETNRFLAVEMDVAETRLALLPIALLEDRWVAAFPTTASPAEWKRNFKRALTQLPLAGLWGVLVSAPGIVDEKAGRVLFSPNLHWTEGVDLPALIQSVLNLPVLLVQEIRALALGHLAANPQTTDFLLVDFGQGVGGAIVKHGRLYDHPLPLSGELGHTPVPGNHRRCGCGAVGCVETLMNRRGLLQSFTEAAPHTPGTWSALVEHLKTEGLPPWLAASLDSMAAVIAGSLNVLGLRNVLITGDLSQLPGGVMEHLASAVQRGALWARFGQVTCAAALRRRAAGLAALGLDRLLVPAAHHEGLRSRTRARD